LHPAVDDFTFAVGICGYVNNCQFTVQSISSLKSFIPAKTKDLSRCKLVLGPH